MSAYISGQAFVVVWRESLEAILIVGIIYAYLVKSERRALRAMWIGVGIGLVISGVLAYLMLSAQGLFTGAGQTYFETSVLLVSAVLMTQMVFWMRRHARYIKAEFEDSVRKAVSQYGLWSVCGVSALAVAREGSEAVIYVYSLSLERHGSTLGMGFEVVLGLCAAAATGWAVGRGLRFLKNGVFFEITSAILLLSAASLATSAVGRLIAENILPGIVEPVWDLSRWVSSGALLAKCLKMLVGYNPRPSLLEVLIYGGYWLLVLLLLFASKMRRPVRTIVSADVA